MSETITAQELFDHVVKAVVAQGVKSAPPNSENGMYRLGDLKCAAGHAIRDDEYAPDLEGRTIWWMARNGRLPSRLVPHESLLERLQSAHDDAKQPFVQSFRANAKAVAAAVNLTMPVLP